MRVLVVLNYEHTEPGLVGEALAEAGAEIDTRLAHLGDALPPDAAGHDAMLVLGGGQNALADDASPYFPGLLALIRDFEAKDKAVLGICLGSQLIARAFGGENKIGGISEVGWYPVSLTPEAKTDAVLGALPESFPIMEWHDDTFTLPKDAVHLASSELVANQAFRLGRAVYGFQFHFEADRRLARKWSEVYRDLLSRNAPDFLERLEDDIVRHGPAADAAGLAIARAWVALV